METLMLKIKTDGRKRFKQKQIAEKLSLNPSTLSEYYTVKYHMDFLGFTELVKVTYAGLDKEDTEFSRIKEFIEKTQRKDDIRIALEWAVQTGNSLILDTSIRRLQKDGDEGSLQLASIYELLRSRNRLESQPMQFFLSVEKLKKMPIKKEETQLLLDIASLYSFFDLHYYQVIPEYAEIIQFNAIEDSYIKDAFKLRKVVLTSVAYMKRGNTEIAESLAETVLDVSSKHHPLHAISIYNLIAELNTFSNYKKSIKYINQALKVLKEVNQENFKRQKLMVEATSDFIKLYNNDFEGLFLTSKAEKAHYCAKQNRIQEGLSILDEIEQENNELSAFQLYYKGLMTNSEHYFQKSKDKFHDQRDYFYKNNLFMSQKDAI